MTERNDLTFAAVVTITLPTEKGSTQLEVILAPADRIEASDGTFKPLGDCTLADLRRFADSLEAEVWAEHEGTTLYELVNQHQADISFSFSDEISASDRISASDKISLSDQITRQTVLEDLSLQSAIILDGSVEENGDEPEKSVDEAENALESDPADIDSDSDEAEVDDDLSPAEDLAQKVTYNQDATPAVAASDEIEAAEFSEESEVEVTVAESEPVHEDKEATPYDEEAESDLAAIRPEVRILGKRRPLNHPTWTAVDILINETAFRDAQAHALSSPGREVAGVLVGPQPEKQPDGRYLVHISDAIIARHTRMQGASVTYTPESWRYVNDRLAQLFPDGTAVIVGWYHTHPGFGIFLSGMDQFIHRNFFTQIWHVALVLDPLAANSGFFCWNREKDNVAAYEFPWPNWARDSW